MPDDRRPSAVLDTNTALDWLLFRDAPALELGRRIAGGSIRWQATAAMRREFENVLARPSLARWRADPNATADAWDRHAQLQPEPLACRLHCTDPDDQVFIDLAVSARADWLVTRDRALLKLARQAALWHVRVLTPQAWLAEAAGQAPSHGPPRA